MSEADLRHLTGTKTKPFADISKDLDIALSIVTEGEALSEIDLPSHETVADKTLYKVDCREVSELRSEVKHDDLTHAEVLESLHLLMKRLEKWWCRFGLQDLAGMGIKSDQRGCRVDEQRALDDSMNDCLMAEVKSVKYSERKHGGAAD